MEVFLAATGADEVLDPMRNLGFYVGALIVVWGGVVAYASALVWRLRAWRRRARTEAAREGPAGAGASAPPGARASSGSG